MKKNVFPAVIFFLLLGFAVTSVLAEPADDDTIYRQKIQNLESLLKSINETSRQITSIQEELSGPRGVGREKELKEQINKLSFKKAALEASFRQAATEADMSVFVKKEKEELNWNVELTELLGPIISELKKMTSRPRKLEKKRREIEQLRSQLPVIRKAIDHVDALLIRESSGELKDALNALKREWENRYHETKTRMNIATRQLAWEQGQKRPLSASLGEILQIFFKSRGRNVILSFLAFIVCWVFLHWLHRFIQRHSPFHQGARIFYVRLFDLLFIFVSLLLAFLAFLAVLFFFGDWLLLSLAIIFLIGLAWASRVAVPLFWNQARLILNFGPVREGERVIYKGIPYKTSSINLFSLLTNDELTGGEIRLPLKDLLELRSRPIALNEPWFPSRQGDWVLLTDGSYGKVEIQTPEMVKLNLFEGGTTTYRTQDYLAQSPTNLSLGFELAVTFGVDYRHQPIVTTEILKVFDQAVTDGLNREGYGEKLGSIQVQFKGVSPSSMDIVIKMRVKENQGSQYELLRRDIQRICVDTCNLRGWTIPFQQVTVHMTPDQDNTQI
ncbi:MAG: hypothetical protein JRI34_09510 [Deltaproteobacteria bacterium]|nr:hypothetical protein [Deltaproteobacteria bacterium]